MLLITDEEGVRTLTLNRPERLNTLTQALIADLHKALVDCTRDPGVKAVVLAGAGRGFCAGADLSGGGGEPDPITARWMNDPIFWEPEQLAARLIEDAQIPVLLHRMPKPTIAAVRGPAAGSGLLLAAACDLRIASETAVFKTAFASAGRCGDPGGAYFLTKLVGPARARELLLLDEKIPAERALAMGLASRVVPDDALDEEVRALALKFARGPGLAYAGIKRNLNLAETASLEDTMAQEGLSNARASLSHDGKEAGRAFMEKRSPNFRGY
ncbi:enoyl-CoA hydratase [Novosphingobium bradum]|uniref:Enoyl-CoA hydratase n=1 Tax=Novosphingobium bradum TaxID=1737444 RepID=A0ABV7IJG6_9SPHN